MELGFHCWVYCQLELREQGGWANRDEAFRTVAEEKMPAIMGEVAAAGFTGIETMAALLATPEARDAHRRGLHESGLDYLGMSDAGDYWDPAQRQQTLDHLGEVLGVCAELGGVHLGLSANPVPQRDKTGDDYDQQAETFRAIARLAHDYDVRVNLHTYSRDAADDFREVREMVARLRPEDLQLGPDLAWLSHGGGNPVEFVRRFGNRIIFCHVRDRRENNQWAEALGEGVEDFAALGEALVEAEYDGPVVFEPAFPDDAPTRPLSESWRMSATLLRSTILR